MRTNIKTAAAHIIRCIASVGDTRHALGAMYRQLDACAAMAERFIDRYADHADAGNFYYTMTVTVFEKRRAVEQAVLAAQLRAICKANAALPFPLSLPNLCPQ